MNILDDVQVIILAAGKGTRMGESELPKVLVDYKGKPLLEYILSNVESLNLKNKPIAVVGFKEQLVKEKFKDRFFYVSQDQQLGTAHAVLCTRGSVKSDKVLILYGDMPFISTESILKLASSHMLAGGGISMLTVVVPNFDGVYRSLEYYGRIIRKSYEEITEVKEFRDCDEREKNIKEVNPGIYLVETDLLWRYLDKVDNNNNQKEYYLTDIVRLAIEDGQEINTVLAPAEEMLGVNSLDDLLEIKKI